MMFRIEKDSMGEVKVPDTVYWGAQTQRAIENFSISPLRIHPAMIKSLALVKKHAAQVNLNNNVLSKEIADALIASAEEVIQGKFDDNFPVDVMQTGSGTSWNMNMNEVLSNRANEMLGYPKGTRNPVHPNDHVNQGQSSNDSIPTSIYIACRLQIVLLLEQVSTLQKAFEIKSQKLSDVLKLGRTHLQDAVPMTLGQEFGAFASQIEFALQQIERCKDDISIIPQGGTAVGTGLNSIKGFSDSFAVSLSDDTGILFKVAKSPFSRMAGAEPFVALAGAISVLAVSLMKIANDLRLLASGPRAALGEVILPSLQPGSSIMPGKVNPVIPEMVIQSASHLLGKVESIKTAAQNGPLQLIMTFPIISHECLTAIDLAKNTCEIFVKNCIDGIQADKERAMYWIEHSLALVTPLATKIGYDKAAEIAHIAYQEKRTIREVMLDSNLVSSEQLEEILDPHHMV